MRDRHIDDARTESFSKDPAYAIELLHSTLEDGDQDELMVILRQMAKAFGGAVGDDNAELNRSQSHGGVDLETGPEIRDIAAALEAVKLRIVIQPLESPATRS